MDDPIMPKRPLIAALDAIAQDKNYRVWEAIDIYHAIWKPSRSRTNTRLSGDTSAMVGRRASRSSGRPVDSGLAALGDEMTPLSVGTALDLRGRALGCAAPSVLRSALGRAADRAHGWTAKGVILHPAWDLGRFCHARSRRRHHRSCREAHPTAGAELQRKGHGPRRSGDHGDVATGRERRGHVRAQRRDDLSIAKRARATWRVARTLASILIGQGVCGRCARYDREGTDALVQAQSGPFEGVVPPYRTK